MERLRRWYWKAYNSKYRYPINVLRYELKYLEFKIICFKRGICKWKRKKDLERYIRFSMII